MLQEVTGNNIDVLLISKTKLDASFPTSQFILDEFTPPYRLDRTQHGGSIILFIREGITSKLLNADTSISGIENLFAEINLRSKNRLISGSYKPHFNSIQNHLEQLSKRFDTNMTRTHLLNKLRKFNCPENQMVYKRQRNYCVKLLKRSKKDFYNNLNARKVTENKHFWETIKPNFTDKVLKD